MYASSQYVNIIGISQKLSFLIKLITEKNIINIIQKNLPEECYTFGYVYTQLRINEKEAGIELCPYQGVKLQIPVRDQVAIAMMAMFNHKQPVHLGKGHPTTYPSK
jgi:Gpi18-like mannosyltransferase